MQQRVEELKREKKLRPRDWTREDKVIMSGLLNFYNANYKAIENVFKEFPTDRKPTRTKISHKGEVLKSMVRNAEFPELKNKESFDKFFTGYFKTRGMTDPITALLPLLETTAFLSDREKIVIRGLNFFHGLQGLSISRILKLADKKMDHDYINRLLREFSQEGNDINLKTRELTEESFLELLSSYLQTLTTAELRVAIEKEKEEKKREYSETEAKIIYGLYTIGKFRHGYIAKIVENMSGNLKEIDRVRVKNACRSFAISGVEVNKGELESLIGVNLEDLAIIYGPENERFTASFTTEERRIMLGWIEYVGDINSLARFSRLHFNYGPTVNSNLTSTNHRSRKMGVEIPTRDEFETLLKNYNLSSIEEARQSFKKPTENVEVPGETIDQNQIARLTPHIDDSFLKRQLPQLIEKPLNPNIILPLSVSTIPGRQLVLKDGKHFLANIYTIKIIILEETEADKKDKLRLAQKQGIKGFAAFLAQPGKMETLLNAWKIKMGLNIDGALLEIVRTEKAMGRNGFSQIQVPIYKSLTLAGDANLENVDLSNYTS
jgi:hypothetical protein